MRSHLFNLALVATLLLLGLTVSSIQSTDVEEKVEVGEEVDEEFVDFEPSEFEDGEELPPKQDFGHNLEHHPPHGQGHNLPLPPPPPPPQDYQAPAYPPPAYQPPAYQAPAYQPPAYQPAAHQAPAYQPAPAVPYQKPAEYSAPVASVPYQAAPPAYQAPPPPTVGYIPQVLEYANFSELDPSYQLSSYQSANFSPPIYGNEIFQQANNNQQAYQQPNYSPPVLKSNFQPVVSPVAQLSIAPSVVIQPILARPVPVPLPTPIKEPIYQAPPVPLPTPIKEPVYQAPPVPLPTPVKQPAYQAPPVPLPTPIKEPIYQAPPVPLPTPVKQPTYQTPPAALPTPVYNAPVASNYSTNAIPQYKTQVAPYNAQPAPYQAGLGPIKKYSLVELVPFIPLNGYVANHWSLFYYRASPYRSCPKNVYLNAPAYRDIEAAFAFGQQQLALTRSASIQYLNSSQHSWAGRHQVFSFLNQQSARMDEEGLLVELVSQYLSERACLTKWDKQRYLPTLTKFVSTTNFPQSHSCSNVYQLVNQNEWGANWHQVCHHSKYRTYDGFCNNLNHPYWGKSNVCHIRLLSPDYADGISAPRNSYNPRFPLPNPRLISSYIHNDIPIEGPYNLMKMQWGQFINHDITNTALSSYDGLVDCCKNPNIRGCWPIYVPPGDRFYGPLNVTCLSFIRSGVCPLCQLGPRQQINKNTAFLDASHIYGNNRDQAQQLRVFRGGLLKFSIGKNGEILLPLSQGQDQCSGVCFTAGDNRVNQHPALTALHTLLLRNHNHHARALQARHPNWSDEIVFQEARRINIAEYQMITYAEYLPIVFGPILSSYYKFIPNRSTQPTYYEPKADPTTWNEYSSASCRFGHSQISSTFGLYTKLMSYGQQQHGLQSFRLKDWFMRPSLLSDGLLNQIVLGLVGKQSYAVDPWITTDVHNHLYQSHKDHSGGDLAATNIWRGRDHGIPGYVHYVEYCFNYKVRGWKDLAMFIPPYTLNQLRKLYKVVENIDLFTGGISEFHFPGADTGPTFACINGIQYYHLKFGDRYWFEHANQAGSFAPHQLDEIKKTTLARLLCRTAYLQQVPQYAFLQPSAYNPIVNCSALGEIDYGRF